MDQFNQFFCEISQSKLFLLEFVFRETMKFLFILQSQHLAYILLQELLTTPYVPEFGERFGPKALPITSYRMSCVV